MRRLAFTLAAALVAASVMLGAAAPAHAAGDPGPINVLPSVVKGAAPASYDGIQAVMYRFSQSPAFWDAVKAMDAGTSTAGQRAIVDAVQHDFRMPATGFSTLSKVAGGAGAVMTSVGVGAWIGVDASETLGLDPKNTLCAPGDVVGGMVSLLGAIDCDGFAPAGTHVPNVEQPIKAFSSANCAPTGTLCVQIRGSYAATQSTGIGPTAGTVYCVNFGGSSSGWYIYAWQANGTTFQSSTTPPTLVSATANQCATRFPGAGTYPQSDAWFVAPVNGIAKIGVARSDLSQKVNSGPTYFHDDPSRTWVGKIKGTDGNTYTRTSAPFKESDASWPVPVLPTLPPEVNPERVTIEESAGGGVVYDQPTTPEYDAVRDNMAECLTGICALQLVRVADELVCWDAGSACAGWSTDPAKASKYQCRYGTHVVDLAECNIYARAFEPDTALGGDFLTDPTGTPIKNNNPSPGLDGTSMAAPVQDPELERNCWAGALSWNPLDWVFTPVKCAFEWAFVPRASVVNGLYNGLNAKAARTGGIALATAVTAWDFDLDVGGCSGVLVAFSDVWPEVDDMRILNACPGDPLAPAALLSSVVVGIAAVLGCIFAVSRALGGVVAYGGIGGDAS